MPLTAAKTQQIGEQFNPMRERLKRQEASNLQQERDSLARNQARLGGGPGGAFIKQEGLAADRSAQRLQQANEGVDAQQSAAMNQAREVAEQRDWQTGERVAGQKYATSERMGSQDFTARESAMARELQRYGIDVNKALGEGQLMGTYGGKQTLAAKSAADQKAMAEAQLTGMYGGTKTLAASQLDQENKVNMANNVISTISNLRQLGWPPEAITAALGQLGLEGFGIDPASIISGLQPTAATAQQAQQPLENAVASVESPMTSPLAALKRRLF